MDYVRDVKPLLSRRCVACHGALKKKAGLRLDTAAIMRTGGDGGPAVVAGKSAESLLIDAVTGGEDWRMPPEGEGAAALGRGDRAAEGVDRRRGAGPRRDGARRPPHALGLPDAGPARGPRGRGRGLGPQPDRRVPRRRARGARAQAAPRRRQGDAPPPRLPRPDRPAPDARGAARLPRRPLPGRLREGRRSPARQPAVRRALGPALDGRLAVQRLGRLSARRSARASRTSGAGATGSSSRSTPTRATTGWSSRCSPPTRSRPTTPRRSAPPASSSATGTSSTATVWLDDTVEHTAKAFLGLTLNCARCHDHKYDPIAQADYYRLRAFFEPHQVRTDRVPGQPDLEKDGLVRVFDADADAKTYLFVRGDESQPDEGQAARRPACRGPAPGTASPSSRSPCPRSSTYPGLGRVVREETLGEAREDAPEGGDAPGEGQGGRRAQAAGRREGGSTSRWPRRASPRRGREWESLLARIAADAARYASPPEPDADALARKAGAAERRAAVAKADEARLRAQGKLDDAQQKLKPGDEASIQAVLAAEKARDDARKALETAREALAQESPTYSPLGPVYPDDEHRPAARPGALDDPTGQPADGPRGGQPHLAPALRHPARRRPSSTSASTGRPPTHPALLDWLAVELMERGWSMKQLHRLIVTSRAYRMQSSGDGAGRPEPRHRPRQPYLWRMNPRRMEAEVVRDSLLRVAGLLDPTLGGPDLDPELDQTSRRRSLYFRHAKEKKVTFLKLFDAANVDGVLSPRRERRAAAGPGAGEQPADASSSRACWPRSSRSAWAATRAPPPIAPSSPPRSSASCRGPRRPRSGRVRTLLVAQAARFADTSKLTPFAAGPAAAVKPAARSAAPRPREPRPRAVQPQRLRDDPITRGPLAMNSNRPRASRVAAACRAGSFLADFGMGFTGLALGAMLHRDGVARADASAGWAPARRPAALRPQGQERHLAVHDRRRQPPGELRPQAGAEQVRRQDDRRDAVQGRPRLAVPEEEPPRGRRRRLHNGPAARSTRCRSASGSAARAGSRSATGGRTSATASTTSPSSARCGRPTTTTAPSSSSTPAGTCSTAASRRSARGSTTAWARSTTTCRSSSSWARRSPTAAAGVDGHGAQLPRPRARRRPARASTRRTRCPSPRPAPDVYREEQQAEFELLGRAQPARRRSSTPTTRRCGPGSSRTSWPSACRRPCPRCSSFDGETAATQAALRPRPGRRRRPSASSAWRRGGWSSAACGSCRSSTAATAAPAPGTPTAT